MCHLKNDFSSSQGVLCKLLCGSKLYSTVVRYTGIENPLQHLSSSLKLVKPIFTTVGNLIA